MTVSAMLPMKGPAGYVTLSGPNKRGYFRMKWDCVVDGIHHQGDTTAGRALEHAVAEVRRIEQEISAGATDRTRRTVADAIAYWLDPSTPRPRHQPWSKSRMEMATRYARNYLTPGLSNLRCMDLHRRHLQAVVNRAPSLAEGKRLREECVSLLTAMRNGDWLLDAQVIDLSGVWWHDPDAEEKKEKEKKKKKKEKEEEKEEDFAMKFVNAAGRPTADQVRALRVAADAGARLVWWRGLAVELAAYSGLRQAELFALRPCDIDLEHRRIRVVWQEHRGERKPPKGRKRRVTIFPSVTPTGYPLLDALTRRCGEVGAKGLLFCTRTGRPLSSSNWHRDVFEPAAMAAGWKWDEHYRVTVDGIVKERKFELTWHSLRHTFATVALDQWHVPITQVALLCGHSSRQVTERLYISADAEVLDAVGKLIR